MMAFLCLFATLFAQPYSRIQDIPLPSVTSRMDMKVAHSFTEMIPYRVELYEEYTDKSRLGEGFKGWAMSSLVIHQYKHAGEVQINELEIAFGFYRDLLSPRIIDSWGPTDLRDTKEQDISRLKPGEFSDVLLYTSAQTFQWYYFASETELRHFEVVIGYQLVVLERIFVKELPVVTPNEDEIGWPVYPGSEFLPLSSAFMLASGDFPGRHYMKFSTRDPFAKVKSWFSTELSMLPHILSTGDGALFQRMIPGVDFLFWPMISIQEVTKAPSETNGQAEVYTQITYEY